MNIKRRVGKGQAQDVGQPGAVDRGPHAPQHQGHKDIGHRLGQGGPDVEVHQAVGDDHVGHGGDQPGPPAQDLLDKAVHGQPGADDRQGKDDLDRVGKAQAQQVKGLAGIGGQRAIDVKEGIAVAKGKVGLPAGVEDAILDALVEFEEKIDAVAGVVGVPEIAGLEQRADGEQREEDDEQDIGIETSGCATRVGLRR